MGEKVVAGSQGMECLVRTDPDVLRGCAEGAESWNLRKAGAGGAVTRVQSIAQWGGIGLAHTQRPH